MRIDPEVEPLVREAFAGAVAGEPDRFAAAVAEIAGRGDDVTLAAVNLAVAVDSMALLALHDGAPLDDEALRAVARDYVATESWAGIAEDTVVAFLGAISDPGRRLPADLPAGELAWVSFALGGWLLAGFLPATKDWPEILDDLLKALESLPTDE